MNLEKHGKELQNFATTQQDSEYSARSYAKNVATWKCYPETTRTHVRADTFSQALRRDSFS